MPEPESRHDPIDTASQPTQQRAEGPTPTEATTGNLFSVDDDALPAIHRLPTVPGYEILDELGRGGMGVVYKARQVALNRLVALKMISAGQHAGLEQRRRFKTEAEAAARLSHPNIVQVYEVGEHDGCPFVALEFCAGDSLRRRLDGTPWPPRQAAELVQTLARAIHVAHQAGIVHRDLKPANVLFSFSREPLASATDALARGSRLNDVIPKISDFGLAKKLDADEGQTTTGDILGTPSYMAPEQAWGMVHEIGPRTDVTALGAILYELLVGRPPFKGETLLETVDQVRKQEPVAPRLLQPKLPRDVETITLKCLQKEPARRYPDAAELADDLGRFLAGEPIRARPVGPAERAWRWARRNPAAAGLVAAVGLLLFAVTGISLGAYLTVRQKNDAIVAEAEEKERQRQAAEAARALADRRANQARTAIDLFINKAQGELADDLFATRARRRLAGLALTALERQMPADADGGINERGLAGAHAQAGDLALTTGDLRRAGEHFQAAHALAEKLHRENPDSDLAAGNLAVSLVRLARLAAAEKKTGEAQKYYERVLALQKRIVESPRSKELTPAETRLSLAETLQTLGRHTEAYAVRAEALKLEPNDKAREKLAESCFVLARAAADPGEKRRRWLECITLREALLAGQPDNLALKERLAFALGQLGDLELFAGNTGEARKLYGRHLALSSELAAPNEVLTLQRRLGLAYYRRATAALRAGDRAASERDFRECLRQRELVAREQPKLLDAVIELMLARARCGQHAEAAATAVRLHKAAGKNVRVLFQAACGYALSSEAAGRATPLGQEYRTKALGIIHEMLAAGYADRGELEHDPDLDPIRDDSGFREALAKLKK
jgi:tetratricopeptide (TPR) repeat protein